MNGQSSFGLQPAIVVLKEGTDNSQGKGQLLTNISACTALSEIVQSTLGPRGMDKLMVVGGQATVSNDGATIMNLLDVVHPAARCLVDIAKSQDSEVGDGTTSVVVLAGSLLREVRPLIEEGVHPRIIIRSFRKATRWCMEKMAETQVPLPDDSPEGKTERLMRLAATSMNSKLIAPCKDHFSRMTVEAVEELGDDLSLDNIGIKQVLGGSLEDSCLIKGVAFQKTFSYAGFEQQRKQIEQPKILLLNIELEWQAEKDNAEIRLEDPTKYRELVEAEFEIIYDKLRKIQATGANVVLSKLPIGDLATQFFADHGIFGAGRVPEPDMKRLSRACGMRIITAVTDIIPEDDAAQASIGTCGTFEERQIGADRYNVFTDFVGEHKGARTATIILRGGADQFIRESERSLHDAIMVVRRAVLHPEVVAGGGAIEMMLSAHLRKRAAESSIPGKQRLLIETFAHALEAIPRNIAENAGFDSTKLLVQLRKVHNDAVKRDGPICWQGVSILNDGSVADMMEEHVWEPSLIKQNALRAATEAACVILSVDQTVTLPSNTQNINQTKSKSKDMKQKLKAAGVGNPIVAGASGAPGGGGVRHFQGRGGK
eukprot:gnl/Dysnectes_brevis/1084_a1212_3882.p1 GENE.gnl/Dysnectes_brevis/1084_a1212_3882~~gnl/Dysnectes_brevis/1084_a1212_3882.p1  ORF type:complete len:607 (+),score=233.40 gnl/Dysnectes_brevis/1084_a1212_3882:22-1821(+)